LFHVQSVLYPEIGGEAFQTSQRLVPKKGYLFDLGQGCQLFQLATLRQYQEPKFLVVVVAVVVYYYYPCISS
jgi:hypothetical protein